MYCYHINHQRHFALCIFRPHTVYINDGLSMDKPPRNCPAKFLKLYIAWFLDDDCLDLLSTSTQFNPFLHDNSEACLISFE